MRLTNRHAGRNAKPAIIFDFGGVLIDWDPRYLYRKLLADDQAIESFLNEIGFFEWNEKQDAGRTFAEAVDELCARYPQHCELIRSYNSRYEESLGGPILPTVEILHDLKTASYPLYALSNWPAEKFRQVRHKFPFFDWFDDLVISGEVGLAKPDPRIFKLLLDRIGRPARECIYIDDSQTNVSTAQSLDFEAILFVNPAQLKTALNTRLKQDLLSE